MDDRRLIVVEKCCIRLTVAPTTGLKNKLFLAVDQCGFDRQTEHCYNRMMYTRLYASIAPLTVKRF